jgi:dihydrofolate synthase/folylpolyglutamate synthase
VMRMLIMGRSVPRRDLSRAYRCAPDIGRHNHHNGTRSEPFGSSPTTLRREISTMPDSVARFHDAVNRLDALIVATPARDDTSREAVQRRARKRMDRLRAFLRFLGDPAAGIPKVHVGGTSGKGSTTTAIAAILTAAGYRTGVHTSPYLQVASEKLQVDGELIEADVFVRLADHLLDRLLAFPDADHITYGEAWIALVMLFLEEIAADVAASSSRARRP